jgi:hypothetical protein
VLCLFWWNIECSSSLINIYCCWKSIQCRNNLNCKKSKVHSIKWTKIKNARRVKGKTVNLHESVNCIRMIKVYRKEWFTDAYIASFALVLALTSVLWVSKDFVNDLWPLSRSQITNIYRQIQITTNNAYKLCVWRVSCHVSLSLNFIQPFLIWPLHESKSK